MAMDNISASRRSWNMAQVKGKDTTPERQVRSILHSLGFRFRLHRRDLPGTPDIVLPKWKTIIFVHGCFWHRHPGCKKASIPTSNAAFWTAKFRRNKLRDKANVKRLTNLGWRVIIIWECELRQPGLVKRRLSDLKSHPTR